MVIVKYNDKDFANQHKLPEIIGNPRQIQCAQMIRRKFFKSSAQELNYLRTVRKLEQQLYKPLKQFRDAVLCVTYSDFWINNRDYLISDTLVNLCNDFVLGNNTGCDFETVTNPFKQQQQEWHRDKRRAV